jgi:glycosyltransferase involved in cell wall biosynthesis
MAPSIAVLTPAPLDAPRGNAVTVARIAAGLGARGVEVRIALSTDPWTDAMLRPPPAAVHAFHAYHSGPAASALATACGAPLVVTLTGTDVSDHLVRPATTGAVQKVLRRAQAVTAFDESVLAEVRAVAPDVAGRLTVVPQSVRLPERGAAAAPAIDGAPCILFPAGIRPVKRPLLPLAPLDAVARRHPGLRLWYVGPALDPDETQRLGEALVVRPWARYLDAVPHAAMRELLEASDIVLNCSASEGGMPNAVAEALAVGRAVVASDIPGNRSLVRDGETGFLFASPAELAEKVERLLGDAALRERLGQAGQRLIAAHFTPAAEIDGYLAVYRRAADGRPIE